MPQVKSSMGVVNQPGTIRTLGRESGPNPICEPIQIYDDDENPKVSLVTHVHVEEEKGREKTSSPVHGA
jgi:hypothetical protein